MYGPSTTSRSVNRSNACADSRNPHQIRDWRRRPNGGVRIGRWPRGSCGSPTWRSVEMHRAKCGEFNRSTHSARAASRLAALLIAHICPILLILLTQVTPRYSVRGRGRVPPDVGPSTPGRWPSSKLGSIPRRPAPRTSHACAGPPAFSAPAVEAPRRGHCERGGGSVRGVAGRPRSPRAPSFRTRARRSRPGFALCGG